MWLCNVVVLELYSFLAAFNRRFPLRESRNPSNGFHYYDPFDTFSVAKHSVIFLSDDEKTGQSNGDSEPV